MKHICRMLFFGIIAFAAFAGTGFASTDCPELTSLQRFAGLITFGNIMLVGGILGTVVFLTWLLYLTRIPKIVYEIGGYAVSVGLIFFAKHIPLGIDFIFPVFAGCIGFAAMLYASSILHNWQKNEAGYCMTLAVIWTIVAMAYQSALIGFISVAALFGALGFFVRSYPFMTVIGFEDEDALNRATGTAFTLLAFFIFYRITAVTSPYIEIFSQGVYLIGGLVGFTGLLILAYQGYGESRRYITRQIPMIVCGIAALFFGSVFSIPEIQKIGGTFFGLYLLEKICDIPTEGKVGYTLKGLIISCVVLIVGYVIIRNKEFFASYILLM